MPCKRACNNGDGAGRTRPPGARRHRAAAWRRGGRDRRTEAAAAPGHAARVAGDGRVVGPALRRAVGRRPARRPGRGVAEPGLPAAPAAAPGGRDRRPAAGLRARGARGAGRRRPFRALLRVRQARRRPAGRGRRVRRRARVLPGRGVRGVRRPRVGAERRDPSRRAAREGAGGPASTRCSRWATRPRSSPSSRRWSPSTRCASGVAAARPRPVPVGPHARGAAARRDRAALMRDELGLDLSPALRELESRVLTDDPTLALPSTEARARVRAAPARRDDVVGRSGRRARGTRRAAARAPLADAHRAGWGGQDPARAPARKRPVERARR